MQLHNNCLNYGCLLNEYIPGAYLSSSSSSSSVAWHTTVSLKKNKRSNTLHSTSLCASRAFFPPTHTESEFHDKQNLNSPLYLYHDPTHSQSRINIGNIARSYQASFYEHHLILSRLDQKKNVGCYLFPNLGKWQVWKCHPSKCQEVFSAEHCIVARWDERHYSV